MIRITETPEGVVISVRAQPGAKRTAIVGIHGKFFRNVGINLRPDKFTRLGIIFFLPDFIPFEPSLHIFLRKPGFVPDFITLSF
jgi:hypothetical protein